METICGIVAPYFCSAVTHGTDVDTLRKEWQLVFVVVAVVMLIGTVVFGVFAKGEEQAWAKESATSDSAVDGFVIVNEA